MQKTNTINTIKSIVYVANYYNKTLGVIDFDHNTNSSIFNLCHHVHLGVKKIKVRFEDLIDLSKTPILINSSSDNFIVIKKTNRKSVHFYDPSKGD